eukprot:PhM_4_TR15940/c0_g1_i2/m.50189
MMSAIRNVLRKSSTSNNDRDSNGNENGSSSCGGYVVLVDYHRDGSLMVSHPPEWALEHLRGGYDDFVSEIESFGFAKYCDLQVDGITENYCVIFKERIE